MNDIIGKGRFQDVLEKESSFNLRKLYDVTMECINALQGVGLNTDNWSEMLVFLVYSKFPNSTKEHWNHLVRKETEYPTFKAIMEFLDDRFRILEDNEDSKNQHFSNFNDKRQQRKITLVTSNEPAERKNKANFQCKVCKEGSHYLNKCDKFQSMPVSERENLVRNLKVCVNCLSFAHIVDKCKSKFKCRVCQNRHHFLLHRYSEKDSSVPGSSNRHSHDYNTSRTTLISNSRSDILFPTSLVSVESSKGKSMILRAVLDPCSEASYISENAVARLQLSKTRENVETFGVGKCPTATVQYKTTFKARSLVDRMFNYDVEAYVLEEICSKRPNEEFHIKVPNDIESKLADPTFNRPSCIDLLLGGDFESFINKTAMIKSKDNTVTFRDTRLGWVVNGNIQNTKLCLSVNVQRGNDLDNLEKAITKFWETEEFSNEKRSFTAEEQMVERLYNEYTFRHSDGRYVVSLPFKDKVPSFVDMKRIARNRFLGLEKRFFFVQFKAPRRLC